MVHDKYSEHIELKKYREKNISFTYDIINNLYSVLHRNIPVSYVRTLDECCYVIVRNLSSEKLGSVTISFIYEKEIDSLSMVYHRFVIDMSITDGEQSIIDLTTIIKYVLLLPDLRVYG